MSHICPRSDEQLFLFTQLSLWHPNAHLFWDSLQADIKDQVYSIVMIDGDLEENVRPVVGAARINQTSENEGMFGRFFLARPDFELSVVCGQGRKCDTLVGHAAIE